MTAVPLPRIVRRDKPAELNHGAYECPICWAGSLTEHERWCNTITGPQLAYPAEARFFRGLIFALLVAVPGWALAAFLIWSN